MQQPTNILGYYLQNCLYPGVICLAVMCLAYFVLILLGREFPARNEGHTGHQLSKGNTHAAALRCARLWQEALLRESRVDLLIMTHGTSPDCFALTLKPPQWLTTQFRATKKSLPISEHHGLEKKTRWAKIKTFITFIIPTQLKNLICQTPFFPWWLWQVRGSTSKTEAPTAGFHKPVANNRLGLPASRSAWLGFSSSRDRSIQLPSHSANLQWVQWVPENSFLVFLRPLHSQKDSLF